RPAGTHARLMWVLTRSSGMRGLGLWASGCRRAGTAWVKARPTSSIATIRRMRRPTSCAPTSTCRSPSAPPHGKRSVMSLGRSTSRDEHLFRNRPANVVGVAHALGQRDGVVVNLGHGSLRQEVAYAVEAGASLVDGLDHPPPRLRNMGVLEHHLLGLG